MSEFDQFSETYQELLDQSVGLTGERGDYFATYKARFVAAQVAPNRIAASLISAVAWDWFADRSNTSCLALVLMAMTFPKAV